MSPVATPHAPAAIGPYSQALVHAGLVYCSGQIALDPASMTLLSDSIPAETRQVLTNLAAVLTAAGSGVDHVLQTTVYLADMQDFTAMNEVYSDFFGEHRPARATIAAAGLPRGARVEIACIAALR